MESIQTYIVDKFVDENGYQYENWIFDSVIYFNKDIGDKRVNGDTDFSIFVKDAFNFRNYITVDLNDVETEIEIYDGILPKKEKEFYSVPVFLVLKITTIFQLITEMAKEGSFIKIEKSETDKEVKASLREMKQGKRKPISELF
jgi:hypothetical protein